MRKMILSIGLIVYFFLTLFIVSIVFAESENLTAEKKFYHLFYPTPKNLMREMSTDRPDKTESAYTVDAGHFQIEISFIDYTYDLHNPPKDDTRVDKFSYLPMNVKMGLLSNVDLQLIYNPYRIEKSKVADTEEKKTGSGDLQTRLKVNVWGNDGGPTALAVMPFVKFPTNTNELGNDALEGGIIFPFAVSLPADWNMGIMTEFDFNRNSQKDYYTNYINTVTFGHSIIGNLSGYAEFFSSFNHEEDSQWIGTVNAGLTYAVSNNIQLDGGVNIGVTRSADDFNPFMGLSMRY